MAWSWIRYQPASALTLWFYRRTQGTPSSRRIRRVAIVAVARRLAIALWRYLQNGTVPEGAQLKSPFFGGSREPASAYHCSVPIPQPHRHQGKFMTIATLGIDLAKNVFAVHGVDRAGKAILIKPRVMRDQL
jgi:hypothetical protein